jgi:hypothetical protein
VGALLRQTVVCLLSVGFQPLIHIEELAMRGITLGCGGGNYWPTAFVMRAQMAAFLVRAFAL